MTPRHSAATGRRPMDVCRFAAAALLGVGCASAPAGEQAAGDRAAVVGAVTPSPASGAAGTLRQDDVTVTLQAGAVLVKVTPLAETVTRLLAPDTRQRLQTLAAAHRSAAAAAAAEPTLLLVSFFSHEPGAAYDSGALELTQLGRLHRPAAVLPVTPDFGTERLRPQETQLAIYVFDQPIDYDQPMTVRYGMQQSEEWRRIVPRLENERARLLRAESRIP